MKHTTRRGFIYFRYILPIISAAVLICLMLAPVYRFVTADTGVGGAVSLAELSSNSFNTCREYLFGSGSKAAVTESFSWTLLILVIALWLFFFVGVLSTVFSAFFALSYFGGADRGRGQLVFLTLSVNRVGLCLWHALMLPVFLLPKIMPLLYDGILAYHVELVCDPFDMLWIALAMYALTVAAVIFSRRYETLEKMNVFYIAPTSKEETDVQDTDFEDGDGEESVERDAYEQLLERAKAEQTERLMRLLNKNHDGDKDK